MKKPTLLELCKTSLYLGTIAYGGPAVLALMKKTFVTQKEWLTEKDMLNAISLAQVLPGATGVDVMGYIGFRLHKLWGGILAPLLYILPATVAIIVLAWAYFAFGNLSFVKALFAGLGALVVSLLVTAVFSMGKSVFKKIDVTASKASIISLLAFVGIYFLKINVIWIILISGLLGFVFWYFTKELEDKSAKSVSNLTSSAEIHQPLTVADFTPVFLVIAIFIIGLLIPFTRDLITTFLGIGALAFGGAFGSIPLIQHQVVDVHGWLTTKQFIDGIAMGQITPGPVLITATFIGYRAASILGAIFATLAVFTPSLIAMIALAGIHDKLQNASVVKVTIKGFQAGFIGLLLAVTLQFAFKSLISWQAWLIFGLAIFWLMILKKNSVWAIVGTVVLSLVLF